jgi:release factor H-coupled RctB family protein
MGTSVTDTAIARCEPSAKITHFYSDNAWIEGSAEAQLRHVAGLSSVTSVAAFPDLHPGKFGPVGCAILASRLFPQFIGPDIGCGMSLFKTTLPVRKLKYDRAAERLRALNGAWDGDASVALESEGLSATLCPEALGTIGGGNHFCEVQKIVQQGEGGDNLDASTLWLLVHSGSRSLGYSIFINQDELPADGLDPESEQAITYLKSHDEAVRWASLNRHIIALRAAEALRCEAQLLCDAPHNLVEQTGAGYLHRKGAAKADLPLVPLAGSRDAPSFLLAPTGEVPASLHSLAHGAGRKYDRASMHGRVRAKKSDLEAMARNASGGMILCEDRQLLIEEAPQAYKNVEKVRGDLEGFGLAKTIATFAPLLTYKKTKGDDDDR